MVNTKKFSQFTTINPPDLSFPATEIVGLQNGANIQAKRYFTWTTAGRPPSPFDGLYGYNTDTHQLEYYNASTLAWDQFATTIDVNTLIANLASHAAGKGASLIGLQDQSGVTSKTVQDLANAQFIVQVNNGSLQNAQALGSLTTGIVKNATSTGVLSISVPLTSIDGLVTAADEMLYTTASNVYATTAITSLGRSLVGQSTKAGMRTTIGLGALTNGQLYIGSTGFDPVPASLTAGTGVSIVSGAGTITISATGGTGTVTNISAGTGITLTPNPIVSTGSIALTVPVVVSSGGTGNTTFTAYSVICAGTTATGAFQNVSGVGAVGEVLTSNGAGTLPSWQASGAPALPVSLANGGTGADLSGSASLGGIVYSTATTLAILAGTATANKVLLSGSSAAPTWSTATYPATAGSAGAVIISDGTNFISSTSLWPNTVGSAGKIVRSNGTINAYSTATFPDTAGTSGNVLVSDGTNWSSSATTGITALGAQAQALNMNSHLISNLTDPFSAQDAATKNYVDQTALNGTSVYAASAASLGTVTQAGAGVGATLTNAGAQATFALDGVNPPAGSNVLIKNTATGMTAANEGIYTVTSVGSGATNWVLTRASNYDTTIEINNTGLIVIQNGSTLAGTAWYNASTIVTVDTTAFSYSRFGTTGTVTSITAGTGLTGGTITNSGTIALDIPVLVTSGGTGLTSTTINQILYSSANNTIAGLATANSAVLITSAGGVPSLGTDLPAGITINSLSLTNVVRSVKVQVFTASGTYTPSTGLLYCQVFLTGSGAGAGAGGGSAGNSGQGGGGGAGGTAIKTYTATLIGATAAIVIGNAGTGGATPDNNGTDGSNCTFTPAGAGAILTANGGVHGLGMTALAGTNSSPGGLGGVASNGDINIPGGNGQGGVVVSGVSGVVTGGGGGSSYFSGSQNNPIAGTGTYTSTGYGSGGIGGEANGGTSKAGGNGIKGICYIIEYCNQ